MAIFLIKDSTKAEVVPNPRIGDTPLSERFQQLPDVIKGRIAFAAGAPSACSEAREAFWAFRKCQLGSVSAIIKRFLEDFNKVCAEGLNKTKDPAASKLESLELFNRVKAVLIKRFMDPEDLSLIADHKRPFLTLKLELMHLRRKLVEGLSIIISCKNSAVIAFLDPFKDFYAECYKPAAFEHVFELVEIYDERERIFALENEEVRATALITVVNNLLSFADFGMANCILSGIPDETPGKMEAAINMCTKARRELGISSLRALELFPESMVDFS